MIVTCSVVMSIVLAQAAPAPTKLLTTADHVKVRAKPTAEGELKGYLFKNMVVDVLERSANEETIGDQKGYWYRISRGALEGWSFGTFFSTNVPAKVIDTYDVPNLDTWWGSRFGWSTHEFQNGLLPEYKVKNLGMDDYRGLIQMARSSNYYYSAYAWAELKRSLLPFLSKHADDPKWDYFRSRVWDPSFLAEMAAKYGEDDVAALVPAKTRGNATFMKELCKRSPQQRPCVANKTK